MLYQKIAPPPVLRSIVRFYWTLESGAQPQQRMMHQLSADSCAGLIFQYENQFMDYRIDGKQVPSLISHYHGPNDQPQMMEVTGAFGLFGVYLNPGTTSALLELPAHEVSRQSLDLKMIWGSAGIELEDKMLSASDNDHRARIISEFLFQKVVRQENVAPELKWCIQEVFNSGGRTSIDHLLEHMPYSRRQFERNFAGYTGLSPKLFSRIIRFQNAMKVLERGEARNLTSLAFHTGYADQSHFIRDFKAFSGLSPRSYLKGTRERAEGFVHVEDL